ncbi:MAG: serine/threonine-protein kinase [Pirellulales bacterium]|nr:serine/threonine-protein kinase [Pirellulales bacterium]
MPAMLAAQPTSTFPRGIQPESPSRARPNTGLENELSQLGPWKLGSVLGRGAWATVRLGWQNHATLPYAIKILRTEWTDHPWALSQFQQEAELGRRLNCPHLLPILGGDCRRHPYYLVMPGLRGETLQQRLSRSGPLSPAQALGMGRQVATALGVIHQAGFVHQDVKPANIWLVPNGHVTLLDLGSCQEIVPATSVWERPLIGSPAYLAPESFTTSQGITPQSDFYSLGVVLYQALCGRSPYPCNHADLADGPATARECSPEITAITALVEQILHFRPIPLRQLQPLLCSATADFIQGLLAKHPARRPSSAADIIATISRLELAAIQNSVSRLLAE